MKPSREYSIFNELNKINDTLTLSDSLGIFPSQKDDFSSSSNNINSLTSRLGSSSVAVNESNGDRYVNTSNLSDNIFTAATALPDLTGLNASMPSSVLVGSSFSISYQVQNQGTASAGYSYTDFYLSSDLNIDSTDIYLGYDYVGGIAAGSYSQESSTLTIGNNVKPSNYYLLYFIDGDGYVTESNESNNGFGLAFSVTQPDLTVQNVTYPSSATVGSSIQFNYQVKNQGTASAGSSNTLFYLSSDLNIDSTDIYLGYDAVSSIAAGSYSQESATLNIGSNVNPSNYYLIYYVDGNGNVPESNENNNGFGDLITINSAGNPDLIIQNATSPTSASVGSTIQLSYGVKNQGLGNAVVATTTKFYLSTDATFSTNDVLLGSDAVSSIAAGASSSETASILIANSIAAGNYYLLFTADADNNLGESNETNNLVATAITINQADLIIQNATAPTSASVGSTIQLSYGVKNQGLGSAVATTTKFYLSTDATYSTNDVLLGSDAVSSIAAGASSSETSSILIANSIAAGNYYLLFTADADGNLAESNETNNLVATAITINQADLIIQNATVPTSTSVGSTIQLSYGVKNQGVGGAVATTTKFYLSTDATFSTNDVLLGSDAVSSIAAGAYSSETSSIVVKNTIGGGNYYLLFRADADGNLAESNETNNVVAKAITINGPQPDLIIQNISVPSIVDPGSLTVNYQLANQGAFSAGTSTTKIYLSQDTALSSDDILLGSDENNSLSLSGLSAGTYSSESYYFSLSSNINFGNYYLLFQADANGEVSESNESNNITTKAITIAAPDLLIENPSAPTSANIGTTISVSYQLRNQGNGNAGYHFTNFYISNDQILSNDDVYLDFDTIYSLAPGAVVSSSISLRVKSNLIPGNYYLLYKADGNGKLRESNENNNVAAKAITITAPDLVIQSFTAPTSVNIGTTFQVNYELKNQGNGSAGGSKSSFYLSRDTTVGNDDDIWLGTEIEANSTVAPSAVISRSTSLSLNTIINAGKYYLIVKADGSLDVVESNETNNSVYITAPITVNPVNGGGFNSTTGYGLVNAAAAVAKALGQSTFADVPDLGGNDWGADAVKAPEVWAKGYTGQGVIVAVVDSGVDYTHPDLIANMWRNSKEIADNGNDDDGNGYIDDVYGWNFVSNNNNPLDLVNGHGTHVAGTIAAVKNSFGVTGIAYNAKVMAVKVLSDEQGTGSNTAIANGIRYAVNNGARVINLSLGGSSPQSELFSAIEYAVSKGAIVVSAAGNDGASTPLYPARYADQLGIAVGAVNYNRTLTDFSHRPGTTPLAYVTAPGAYSDYFGIGIYSTIPGGDYGLKPGTSMAAPHVAGVVALMLSAKSNLTDAQVRAILTSTAANGGTLPSQTATSTISSSNTASSISSYTTVSISLSSNTTASNGSNNFNNNIEQSTFVNQDVFVNKSLWRQFIRYQASNENNKFAHWEEENDGKAVNNKRKKILEDDNNWLLKLGNQVV